MKRVIGQNVKVSTDPTGGFIGVDWDCPYCGGYNAGLYFTSKENLIQRDFEIDHECEECKKMVTIECRNSSPLF